MYIVFSWCSKIQSSHPTSASMLRQDKTQDTALTSGLESYLSSNLIIQSYHFMSLTNHLLLLWMRHRGWLTSAATPLQSGPQEAGQGEREQWRLPDSRPLDTSPLSLSRHIPLTASLTHITHQSMSNIALVSWDYWFLHFHTLIHQWHIASRRTRK